MFVNLFWEYLDCYNNTENIKKVYEKIYAQNINDITDRSLYIIIMNLAVSFDYDWICSDIVIDTIKYCNGMYNIYDNLSDNSHDSE
jgi:hypothetical protein